MNRDSHKGAETRNGLQPIVDFLKATGAAGIGTAHLTKGTVGKVNWTPFSNSKSSSPP
jgi:hypothetical protein